MDKNATVRLKELIYHHIQIKHNNQEIDRNVKNIKDG